MNNKIEKLTDAQEAKLDTYFTKWVDIGLKVRKLVPGTAKEKIAACYTAAGLKAPTTFEVLPSPYAMLERGAILELGDGASKKDIADRVKSLLSECCYGQHDANWLGLYDFFRKEVGLKEETEEVAPMIEAAKSTHWWLPYDTTCLMSEYPTVLKMESDVLHCDTGPAMLYADGFALYYMYGVNVPEWLACTPAKELDIAKVMSIPNVDQRMAGLRKVGIHNVRDALKVEVLDTYGTYELWTIEVEGRRIGPYLKMVGPTTGETHVEGVGALNTLDPNIKTCKDALQFRNPKMLTYSKPLFTA